MVVMKRKQKKTHRGKHSKKRTYVKKFLNPQKQALNDWFDTTRYVYNKTLACIRGGFPRNEYKLRDHLVTSETKKTQPLIKHIDDCIEEISTRMKEVRKEKIPKEEKQRKIDILTLFSVVFLP